MPRIKDEEKNLLIVILSLSIIISAPVMAMTGSENLSSFEGDETSAIDSVAADSISRMTVPGSSSLGEDTLEVDTVILEPSLYQPGEDTLLIQAYQTYDTIQDAGNSPTRMLFHSVVFPGGGQLSNGRYLKAAVVFAAETYFIYQVLRYNRLTSEWRRKWKTPPGSYHASGPVIPIISTSASVIDTFGLKSTYFDEYTSYRDTRNTYLWYTALTVFLSMFDAYVDAHLRNFPDDAVAADRFSLDIVPGEETRLSLRYNF